MKKQLRALIVEDSRDDAELMLRELERGGFDIAHERVDSPATMRLALQNKTWDIVISDYSMPGFTGDAALALLKQIASDIPFICVSGTIGEDIAVEIIKAGANDYVMKDRLGRLITAVERELEAAQLRRSQKRSEAAVAYLAAIVESSEDAIVGMTLDGIVKSWNKAAEHIYGYTATEMIGQSISRIVPENRPHELPESSESIKRGGLVRRFETLRIRKDGSQIDVAVTTSQIRDAAGTVTGTSAITRDITERKREEEDKLKLIDELTAALARIKTLSGLLPICSSCKKIRDDQGHWQAVETYIKLRSDAEFSHGLCPDCMKRLYPEYQITAKSQ